MFDSVRTRLTLWYVAVLAVVLLGFSLTVYGLLGRLLQERLDESLLGILDAAATSLAHDAEEGQSPEDGARSTVTELSHRRQRLAIFDTKGRLLSGAPGVPDELGLPRGAIGVGEPQVYSIGKDDDDDDDHHRVAVLHVRLPNGTAYLVAATQPMEPITEEIEALGEALVIAVPLTILVAAGGGWFLARKTLKPVVAMAEEARRMGATDTGGDLQIANPRDELGRLAIAFNDLLSRIRTAFALQRQFMADASHELRTPLATIQTAASVSLQQEDRSKAEYREAMGIVVRQARRLARIVDEMFTLARADSGHASVRSEKLDMGEVVHDAGRAAAVLASGRQVEVVVHVPDEEVPIVGDPELLGRLIQNLLHNAIRHSRDGASVQISLSDTAGEVRVTVHDQGSGIPEKAQPRVFDRFFRADEARSGEGAGLGLAIARWIARAHGGELALAHSRPGDTLFVLTLPHRPPQPQSTIV
jgi:heavy metal sensor kinase